VLADGELVAFVSARNLEVADGFYRGVLGLRRVESSEFAMAYDVNGTQLRVTRVETLRPAPFTVLGWKVEDLTATVLELRRRGVVFERYEGLTQDEHDAWTAPGGSRVAWFSDPDGNLLSLQQAQA
jgi:catechol 2,3-dioxygenase-like lactoylglutathione lyase family enzyme